MVKFLLSHLEIILQKLSPEAVKVAIDGALDALERYLDKDGLTGWEKVANEGIQYIRRSLAITEDAGSPYEDK